MRKILGKLGVLVVLGIFLLVCLTTAVSAQAQSWDVGGNGAGQGCPAGGTYALGTTTNSDVQLITAGTQRMFIDRNGNIGIGISPGVAPASLLHVDQSNPVLNPYNIAEISRIGATGTTNRAIAFGVFDTTGEPVIQAFDQTTGPNDGGVPLYINPKQGGVAIGKLEPPDAQLDVESTSTQLRLTYKDDPSTSTYTWTNLKTTQDGWLYINPNGNRIGIDTSTPSSTLDVFGTITGDGLVIDGSVSGTGFNGWDQDTSNDLTTSTDFLGDVIGKYNSMDIATNAIGSSEIAANAVTASEIAANAVTASEIAANAVGSSELASTTVSAGSYGSSTQVAQITVDSDGRITSASNVAIDFAGSETDPEVGSNTQNYVPKWDGSKLITGSIYDNGNIGIGTTSPAKKLSVGESNGGSLLIDREDSSIQQGELLGEILFDGTDRMSTVDAPVVIRAYAGYDHDISGTTGTLYFETKGNSDNRDTAASVRMCISKLGHVGIGTTSPIGLFEVSHDGTSSDFSVSGASGKVGVGDQVGDAKLDVLNVEEIDSFRVDDSGDADTTPFIIDCDGKVGIGTASPSKELEVNGDILATGDLHVTGAIYDSNNQPGSSGEILISTQTGTDWSTASLITGWVIFGNDIYSSYSGNVGIGVAGPASKLAVDGGVAIGSTYASSYGVASGVMIVEDQIGVGTNSPQRKMDVKDGSNPQLRLTQTGTTVYTDFQTTSSGHLYINPSGGKVGLGTSSPDAQLELGGDKCLAFQYRANHPSGSSGVCKLYFIRTGTPSLWCYSLYFMSPEGNYQLIDSIFE